MEKERLIPDRRRKVDRTRYIRVGFTAFLVLAAVVLLVFTFVKSEGVSQFFADVKSALAPIIYGCIFAFLLTPVVNFFDKIFSRAFQKHAKKLTRAKKLAKGLSITLSIILGIVGISAIVYLVAPEIITTVSNMVKVLPDQAQNFLDWFDGFTKDNSVFGSYVQKVVETGTAYVEDFFENTLMTKITDIAQFLLTGIWDVVNVVYNLVIGFVCAVYILSSRERFAAQAKKLTYAIFRRKAANNIIRTAKRCNAIFSGAVIGKIIDSMIIGLLCFVGMSVIGLPYAVLISTIVGVTNIIPFFGPYIGAIPSALLVLFVDPLQCLYFVIFIILLQQFDCNILDPRIVGGNIGLSAFWVLFACIFFGGMFGIGGLVLGVPVFACLYTIVKEIVENRLRRKGLMTETDDYAGVDSMPEQEYVLVKVGNSDGDEEDESTEAAEASAASGAFEAKEQQEVESTGEERHEDEADEAHSSFLKKIIKKRRGDKNE